MSDMSDPSTSTKSRVFIPGYINKLHVSLDHLDPPDGAYPFIDWTDLSEQERSELILLGVSTVADVVSAAERFGKKKYRAVMNDALRIAFHASTYIEATAKVTNFFRMEMGREKIRLDALMSERRMDPVGAAPHHFMASAEEAREIVVRGAPKERTRMYTFKERVNAFTMLGLSGQLIRPGDLIGGGTLIDTRARPQKDGTVVHETVGLYLG